MRKFIIGAAAAALVASGAVAQAAPLARTAAPVEDSEAMAGSPILLGLIGAVALGLIIWQINDDDDDELPASA